MVAHGQPCSQEEFKGALNTLRQRGPDAGGQFTLGPVTLGHRRLSIIDTSEGANQPLSDPTGQYTIVFNGEIFNYRELAQTRLSDTAFRTHSDTEVLLHLLIRYGTECLNWLSGFFAFALLDHRSGEVLIARDRYGKKPLLLYRNEGRTVFGSELKALLPLIPKKELRPEAVQQYFRLNYVPPLNGMLKGLRKLPPGHWMRICGEQSEEGCYYRPVIRPEAYGEYSYETAQNKLRDLMFRSVEDRLVSDVPLGAFLSGGIDSSVVVAVASQIQGGLKTFSIGYRDNPLYDESHYAKLVADRYKTDHQVFMLQEDDYKQEVFHVLDYLDEPFADSSCIPQFILCRKTREQVTVALSGDGGDEVFAGYRKHRAEWMMRNRKLTALAARWGAPLLRRLPQNKNTTLGNLTRKMVRMAEGASLPPAERYLRWCSILGQNEALALLHPNLKNGNTVASSVQELLQYAAGVQGRDMNDILLADLGLVLPGDMLHKVDMMSMANSLEVRSPFLDYRIVDFAFGLPATYKMDRQLNKRIVQDSFRDMLPEALYNRPKMGFEIPLLEWFRKDFSGYIFGELLDPDFIEAQGIFNVEAIQAVKNRLYSASPGNIQATVWALTVFQHWYRRCFGTA